MLVSFSLQALCGLLMPPEPLAIERFVALFGSPGQITDNASTATAGGSVRSQIRALLALLRLALVRADALKRLLELLAHDWAGKLQSECGRCMPHAPPAAGSAAEASDSQPQPQSHEPTFCYYNVCYEMVAQLFLHVLQLLRYLLVERSPVDVRVVPLEACASGAFALSKDTLSSLLSTLIHLCHRAALRRSVLDEEKREEAAAESSGASRSTDRLGSLRKQIKLSLAASSTPLCTHFQAHEFTRRPHEGSNEAALKRRSLLFPHSSWLFSLDELTATIAIQSFSLLVALISHSAQLHDLLSMTNIEASLSSTSTVVYIYSTVPVCISYEVHSKNNWIAYFFRL